MEKSNLKLKIPGIILFAILTINVLIALFGVLSVTFVNSTDEACYGINAYEMLKNGNIWVNTLKYKTDYYNSKPPLMLWLILIGYKIYGCNAMGLRIASAVCGLFLFFIGSYFVYRKKDGVSALLFAAFLPACTLLFNYHMMRSGDTDSLYGLCFILAMIGLINASQNPMWLVLYGLSFGLGFMAKSTHAALIIIIGILCIPFLVRYGTKIRHIVFSALAAVLVILPWFIARVGYDGLDFIKVMVFGETIANATTSSQNAAFTEYFSYIVQFAREPICDISFAIIIIAVVVRFISGAGRDDGKGRLVSFIKEIIDYRRYVLIVWFIVVVGAFSAVKARLEWYIYVSYIPLVMMAAECGAYLVRTIYRRKKTVLAVMLFMLMISAALAISVVNTSKYPWNGTGGNPKVNLGNDLEVLRDNAEIATSGRTAYIETPYNDYKPQNCWELDCVFYLETITDMKCMDGGAPEFLATDDMDAVLIIDKSLWDQYSDVLTGYVILQDNNYLIFSKHKYGE